MIENEKQKEVTLKWLNEFEEALTEIKAMPVPATRNEELGYQLDIDAYTSQVEEFREGLAEYEKEKSGLK